jgi:hypothetical protein
MVFCLNECSVLNCVNLNPSSTGTVPICFFSKKNSIRTAMQINKKYISQMGLIRTAAAVGIANVVGSYRLFLVRCACGDADVR